MKVKRILSLATVASMIMGSAAFAAVPANSVVLGDEGYAVELLFDNDYTAQIQAAANQPGAALCYNLGAGWKDIFTGNDITDFSTWPQISYTDAAGATTVYDVENGDPVAEGLSYTVNPVVQYDGTDYYVQVTFNKELNALGADVLADLGDNQYLSVNGELDVAGVSDIAIDEENAAAVNVYLTGAAAIADTDTIAFTFNEGAIVAADDSELAAEDLDVSVTLTENPANDEEI